MPSETDTTGTHALPEAAPASGGWRRDILTMVLAGLLGGGGGFASSQIDSAATEARAEQRVSELERRMGQTEGRLEGVEALRRDVAALSATMSAQNTAIAQRLGRIEDRLDRGPSRD